MLGVSSLPATTGSVAPDFAVNRGLQVDLTDLRRVAYETLLFVKNELAADGVSFNLLHQSVSLLGLGQVGIPEAFGRTYHQKELWRIDPLEPVRLGLSCDDGLFVRLGHEVQSESERYRRFLSEFDVQTVADMVFRREGDVIGGISLFWTSSASLPRDLAEQGRRIQEFIEFVFGRSWRTSQIGRHQTLTRKLGLTPRECEVVELLCLGRTNHDIAICLEIGLPTVKSHLANLFEKFSVENRTALIRRALLDLN